MVKELLIKDGTELQIVQEKMNNSTSITIHKVVPPLRVVDHPELSLASYLSFQEGCTRSSSSKIDANSRRKRKLESWEEHSPQTSFDFHLNDPLPYDWEQCLDLQSGSMYYLNRKTLKKSWERPKEQKLDLELNISTLSSCKKSSSETLEDTKKERTSISSREAASSSMVAIACFNCHLLVMLCRSSPSCPNCKYMHSLLLSPMPSPEKVESVKPLETLSLLH